MFPLSHWVWDDEVWLICTLLFICTCVIKREISNLNNASGFWVTLNNNCINKIMLSTQPISCSFYRSSDWWVLVERTWLGEQRCSNHGYCPCCVFCNVWLCLPWHLRNLSLIAHNFLKRKTKLNVHANSYSTTIGHTVRCFWITLVISKQIFFNLFS